MAGINNQKDLPKVSVVPIVAARLSPMPPFDNGLIPLILLAPLRPFANSGSQQKAVIALDWCEGPLEVEPPF